MLLLHVYHPDKRAEDQVFTWAATHDLERTSALVVVHYPTLGEDGYWRALELVWGHPGAIIVLEQDIVPKLAHIVELARCPQHYCAYDFRLANGVPWSTLPDGHGFGLTKIDQVARDGILAQPPVPHVAWPDTVPTMHERLRPVHVHGPRIEHHHGLA
jgi:hypothetical protein